MRGRGRPRGSVARRGRALDVQLDRGTARDKVAIRVGEVIRHAREDLDVSAEELALRLGIDKGTVHGWERGRNGIPLGEVLRVSRALGMSLVSLVECLDEV